MNTGNAARSSTSPGSDKLGESTKLVSLLALAAGAAAIPQTGNADIIFTDLSANPVKIGLSHSDGFASSYDLAGLPMNANSAFGFRAFDSKTGHTSPGSLTIHFRTVTVGQQQGSFLAGVQGTNGFALPRPLGAAWNSAATMYTLYPKAAVGFASTSNHAPNSYNHMYLGLAFQDVQHGGDLRYGWIEIGLNISNAIGPDVTIYGYAWDNSGVEIAMGELPVPEPAPVGVLALGALAFGAKGLRAWRRNRPATC